MEWLSAHPDKSQLEEWRKEQLFAMASVFYSLNGWPTEDNPLAYSDECQWSGFRCTDGVLDTISVRGSNANAAGRSLQSIALTGSIPNELLS
mmetsp:Transcript_15701/g.43312  ORF Transcript_15701/g.43312 Transcript_15701/m.43312 type:complete len:92 (+) Transcript_15701:6007-6282(+)